MYLKAVPDKPTSKSINTSVFFNPFKFKRGRRCEPKNAIQITKKKDKGRRQPLALHQLQLYKHHHPIVYPLVYPGDEPVMAITVNLIIVPPLKITSVSPSLVAVYIDESVPVLDNENVLEKLVKSSDVELDEVVKFGSLCSVTIPETFLSSDISTADVVADDYVYYIDLGNLNDYETIVTGNKNKIYHLNKVDTTVFYNDYPWAQMDDGAGVSVTNLVSLLHNVKFSDAMFKSCVHLHGDTKSQGTIIKVNLWVYAR